MAEKKFPVSESITVLQGSNLYKTDKWWAAVLLVQSFGKKQIATYLWNKKGDEWKRRQKFVIRDKGQWLQMKEEIEKLLPQL
ncbi:hypothetical protein E3J74_04850 [Candidatus Bathyarchaeota archaeon]|nr:MAG: hypothetical protein E3J74_04850 [Candidatus Bathyarchaeota archaeon]